MESTETETEDDTIPQHKKWVHNPDFK
jgi:hypothetical protein